MQLKVEMTICKYSYRKDGYHFYLNEGSPYQFIVNTVSLLNIFKKEEIT